MDIFHITTQELLERISRHCPESLYVYLHCINRVNEIGKVVFTKEQVDVDMSESWLKFKNHVKKLARENILEWIPTENGIEIRLAELDE